MTAIWISVWKRCQHPHIMGEKKPKPVVSWLPAAAAICLDGTFLLLAWLEWFTRTLWVPGSNSWKRAGCISHHGLCFFFYQEPSFCMTAIALQVSLLCQRLFGTCQSQGGEMRETIFVWSCLGAVSTLSYIVWDNPNAFKVVITQAFRPIEKNHCIFITQWISWDSWPRMVPGWKAVKGADCVAVGFGRRALKQTNKQKTTFITMS